MPTNTLVLKALALLGVTFNREITDPLTDVYRQALKDLTDEQLQTAVGRCVTECRFFPVPAEIRECAGLPSTVVDHEALLRRINSLGHYHANVGWVAPRTERVREVFGESVAAAYAMAGASRLFSAGETSRDIAEREFAKQLAAELDERPHERALLTAPARARARALIPAPLEPTPMPELR